MIGTKNKKTWLTFGLFSLIAGGGPLAHATSLGFHGGLSASQFQTPSDLKSSAKTGFIVGAELEVPLEESVFLQPELSYGQRNFSIVDVAGIHLDGTYGALEVPIFLKGKFGSRVHPYVMAGPNFIVNTHHGLTVSSAGQSSSLTFNPRAVDFAVDLGTGIEWSSVFLSLRYSVGLLDVDDKGASWRSRGFQGLLGFRL